MSAMDEPNASQPASTVPRPRQTDADTGERNALHFEPLTVPDLISVPLFLAWLRKPFQRRAKT